MMRSDTAENGDKHYLDASGYRYSSVELAEFTDMVTRYYDDGKTEDKARAIAAKQMGLQHGG